MSLTLLWSKWLWMYETLPSYVLLLICMLHSALCIYLTRHLLFFLCHIYFSVSPFMSLSCCFWMSLTLCVPFCLYFCVYFPLWASPCISLYLYSGCLWVCFRWHAYLVLHFSLYLSFCACGYGLFVSVCVSFSCSHLCVHHWVVISLCPLPSVCLSVQHACGRVGRQEKLPWYTSSIRPSLSVKRLKEII